MDEIAQAIPADTSDPATPVGVAAPAALDPAQADDATVRDLMSPPVGVFRGTDSVAETVEMLREELVVLGAVRLRDFEKAQQEVVAVARKLEEEGLIVTGAAAGEAYVV